MVHLEAGDGDGGRHIYHAAPLPRHNSTGESKTNFEWDRWLSVGCQAGPSTPCIPLIVGSRCRDNSRQAAECSGLAPFHVHRLGELIERRKGKSKMMLITHNSRKIHVMFCVCRRQGLIHVFVHDYVY